MVVEQRHHWEANTETSMSCRYRHTHTQINNFIHRKQSVLLSVLGQNLHSFMTQEIPDGIQVMSNSCWRGKLSVREISMSRLAHPEGVWPKGCLAGLFSLAGQKPGCPWAQKRRSDTLGSSKLLQIIWQAQIIPLRLIPSQREGEGKFGYFHQSPLGMFSCFSSASPCNFGQVPYDP